MRRPPRALAAAVLLPLLVQATGAASLPALIVVPPAAYRPPPAALAPARAAKAAPPPAPARGTPWLESARVVAAFVAGWLDERLAPAPAPRPAAEEAVAVRPDAVYAADAEPAPLPAPAEAPRDRMLIAMAPGERLEGVIAPGDQDFSAPPTPTLEMREAPVLPPFREPWRAGAGVRGRVSYLRPHGTVRGFAEGFAATMADGTRKYAAGRLTAPYRREFPIYYHGEMIEVELELVNASGRDLRGVTIQAVQETFRPVGTEGARLAPPATVEVPGAIPAGGRAVVRWWARLEGPAHAAVNLEQTHVRVTAGPADSGKVLLDAPQAGVIDPPGPGLL